MCTQFQTQKHKYQDKSIWERERMDEVGEGWCGREQIRHTIPLCELFIRGFVHLRNSLLNRLLGSSSGLLLPKQRYHLKCSSCRCCCCGSMMIVAEGLSKKFGLPYYCSSTPGHACHGFSSSSSMSFPAAAVLTTTPQFSLLSRTHSRWRRNGLDCYCCCDLHSFLQSSTTQWENIAILYCPMRDGSVSPIFLSMPFRFHVAPWDMVNPFPNKEEVEKVEED